VRMFRDPLTWLGVLAWLRFAKIDPLGVVERTHDADRAGKEPAPAKTTGSKP
jgi:hypothetical protein